MGDRASFTRRDENLDDALKRGNQAEVHFYMDKAEKEPTE